MSSQHSGKTIVVSIRFEIKSLGISNRVDTSSTNALLKTSVLIYDLEGKTEDASPDDLIIFDQPKEPTKR